MAEIKTCFVIIGYGPKPSFATGVQRMLDLNETYDYLIKPVFDELNIECYRAIDKNLTGSIDKLMLREIRNADIALADISTLNANVMWELGVRHALKPRHTIMICEKEQIGKIPFDINSFIVHQYIHSDQGIPHKEVDRFKKHLKKIVEGILQLDNTHVDSPVFTFLGDEMKYIEGEKQKVSPEDSAVNKGNPDSFASLLEAAEKAKKAENYDKALELFSKAKQIAVSNMAFRENIAFIVSRQALCTYKSQKPTLLESLVAAREILKELVPEQSQDTEVLGLSGAINKRLHEITSTESYLDAALGSYERGFVVKNDYYNGINAAFMLYRKACLVKNNNGDWEDLKLKADYLRNATIQAAQERENQAEFNKSGDAVWVLYTLAEGYFMKDNLEKSASYEIKAAELAKARGDKSASSSYATQKAKLIELMSCFK